MHSFNHQFIRTTIWGGGSLLPIFFIFFFGQCHKNAPFFEEKNAAQCGIGFQNTLKTDQTHNFIDYSYAYNGGGVGAADLDNDGLPELVFTGNQVPTRMYRNKGSFQFEEIPASSGFAVTGWSTGVTFADINTDGLLDIYICRSGNYPPEQRANLCFINQGNLQFKEMAQSLGLADQGWSSQAAFFDYDRDGDLDCYVMNATNTDRYPNRIKKDRKLDGTDPASDHLYRNDNGHFTDATTQANLGDDAWGLGLAVADYNHDGWPDLYVGNDFLGNDLLLLNQRDGTFQDMADSLLGHTSHFSMGCDAADYDNDGLTDIFVADMMPSTNLQRKKMTGVLSAQAFGMMLDAGYAPQYMRNTLQRNRGPLGFSEIGQMAGVYATDWTWSPLFADLDLDGLQDLTLTTGYLHDIIDMDFILQNSQLGRSGMDMRQIDQIIKEKAAKQPGYATPIRFFQQKDAFNFTDQTTTWTTAKNGFHNGSAIADLDGDGDLDLVSNNLNAPPTLLANTCRDKAPETAANYLNIQLPMQYSIGATVRLTANGIAQQRYISHTHGYLSAGDGRAYFGLANAPQADRIEVIWPDGTWQVMENVPANQVLNIEKNNPQPAEAAKPARPFEWAAQSTWRHTETPYNDFDVEPLLPHQFAREGPGLALGDANGDGRQDIFLTGAAGQNGCLMLQLPSGTYAERTIQDAATKPEEDVAALFCDVDQDNDQDLVVVSGGNELEPNAERYSPRLYLNDGRANYTRTEGNLPKNNQPGSCIAANDFDRDGDQDLFIGGRRTSLQYGVAGKSQLLVNDGKGNFSNQNTALAPALEATGMVTDAAWADMDGDGQTDLVVVGEWMPVRIFYQRNGQFEPTDLPHTEGFWYTAEITDLDGDGDLDVLGGNIGRNNKYGITAQTPLQLFSKDFDGNGYFDPIVGYFVQGKRYTVHGRDELTRQLPKLRKQYNTYASYAQATLEQVFPEKERADARSLQMEECRSMAFFNSGKGSFSSFPLPDALQTAPLRDFCPTPDERTFIAVGNDYTFEPGSGRMDAALGGQFAFRNGQQITLHSDAMLPRGDYRRVRRIEHPTLKFILIKNNGKASFL